MMFIPASLLAITAFLATLVKLSKKEYEHAFTRFLVCVFYASLIKPGISIEDARELNRWFWFLLLGIEVIVFVVMTWIRRRIRNEH